MEKISTKYYSTMSLDSGFDGVYIVVNHPETPMQDVQIQVKSIIPDRWRTADEAVAYYAWIVDQIKELKNSC